MSLLIAGLILYSSYGVLRESATVLLEGTPAGMDMPAVIAAIKAVPGVLDVHDLHVWMVGPGVVACSCHIVVAEQSIREGQQVLRAVVQDIHQRFHINHTTVQVEAEGCDANDMYCVGQRLRTSGTDRAPRADDQVRSAGITPHRASAAGRITNWLIEKRLPVMSAAPTTPYSVIEKNVTHMGTLNVSVTLTDSPAAISPTTIGSGMARVTPPLPVNVIVDT